MALQEVSFEEYLAVSTLTFEWADSYDTKDWNRLARSLAPQLEVDYTPVSGMKWAAISSSDFIKMCSSLKFLGSKCFITQHNIGASKYTKVSSSKIVGTHQLQARHILYGDTSKATVIIKGDFHGVARLIYSKSEDGGWKFAGLSPTVYGVEHSSIDELMGTIAARVESGELVD